MPNFSETVSTSLAGRTVRAAMLVFFDFAEEPMRVWQGFGSLVTNDGNTWRGTGEFGSVDGIESALGGTAPQVTFSLSGVDATLIAKTLDASAQVRGRDVTIYLQFFDDDWKALDQPYAIWAGVMDVMRVKADGPTKRMISLTAETLFARRGIPAFGFLSPADQNQLFGGDKGLDQVPTMANKSVNWPVF